MADQPDIAPGPPQVWIEALERAEADIAAGRLCDGTAVRQRLRDSIERMRAGMSPEVAKGDRSSSPRKASLV